jgi:hypothetical protein
MNFIVNDEENVQTNLSLHSIDISNKHHLYRLNANLSCFHKSTFYAGIRIFNSLPRSLTTLGNEEAQFKVALRSYLNTHSFYSVEVRPAPQFTMHIFWVLHFIFNKNTLVRCCCWPTALPHSARHIRGIYHIVRRAFLFPVDIILFCYQPCCSNCLHLAIIFKFVAANILLQRCKQMIIAQRRISLP